MEWNSERLRDDRPDEVTTTDGVTVRFEWDVDYTVPSRTVFGDVTAGRGDRAWVVGVPGKEDPFGSEPDYAANVRSAWNGRPVAVDGITDLATALQVLIGTGQAYAAQARQRERRAERLRELLQLAAQEYASMSPPAEKQLEVVSDGGVDPAMIRDSVVIAVLTDGTLDLEDVAQAAGLTAAEVQRLARYVEVTHPGEFLSIEGFARRIGVSVQTLRAYKSRGRLPQPDIVLGGSPGWLPATVDAFQASRPGQGYRTDRANPPSSAGTTS
jgi:HAMP domain-containing protein